MHHHFIDRFAMGNSPVHRLDARAKLVAVLGYSVVLISFDRYAVADLAPMAVLPLALLWFAHVPVWFAVRRVAILSPFILMLVLMSPIYDRYPHEVTFGPWNYTVSGGWLTAADIAIKFALSVLALTAMMCVTRFTLLLEAMRRLGMPQVIVMQLGFLYRYIFVLIDEAMRVRRARDFRGGALVPVGRRLAAVGGVIGTLFVRTLNRSERIHLAMATRGYRGEPHSLSHLRFTGVDAVFLIGVCLYLVACRYGYPTWF
ncbi:MAG TPA: cobalt ECF transporter T component CbiQ [Thermoguttaceae bacterium]|nr:cobalt ECF transporter T component CbiQ [Thermoguttaceae bacterium]